jgi:hypothetical protein
LFNLHNYISADWTKPVQLDTFKSKKRQAIVRSVLAMVLVHDFANRLAFLRHIVENLPRIEVQMPTGQKRRQIIRVTAPACPTLALPFWHGHDGNDFLR